MKPVAGHGHCRERSPNLVGYAISGISLRDAGSTKAQLPASTTNDVSDSRCNVLQFIRTRAQDTSHRLMAPKGSLVLGRITGLPLILLKEGHLAVGVVPDCPCSIQASRRYVWLTKRTELFGKEYD
jgi:hypothetical protein